MEENINEQKLEDGHELTRGIVVSRKGGYYVSVYRCECKREQTAKHDGFLGGLSEPLVEKFGWRKIDGKWECPYCSGNTANLDKFFDGTLK